jgi:hypothetical protein
VTEIPLLFLILAMIVLIVEVATVMLNMTGLDRDTARFQAVSIITASGYTTSESELVTRHPVRRKIAMFLMVLGPITLAFIISIIIRLLGTGFAGPQDILTASGALLLLYIFSRNPRFVAFFDRQLERQLTKQPGLRKRSVEEILRLDNNFTIVEAKLANPAVPFVNKLLKDTRLRDKGLMVLSIRRGGSIIHAPRGTEELLLDDILLVYGRSEQITQLIELTE